MSNTVINDIENDAEQIDAIVQKELSDIGVNSANFNGHKLLKKSGEKIPYTPEHIEEYKKCAENPIYFAENYVYIVNIERGREKIELYKYQKEMIENFAENRFNVVLSSRQSGKCQIYDSIITVRNKKFNNGTPFSIKIGDFYSWIAFRQGFSLAGLFNFENEPINPKFIDSIKIKEWEIKADFGWMPCSYIHKTVPFQVWELETSTHSLQCADTHIVFDKDSNETYVEDLEAGDSIITDSGIEPVVSLIRTDRQENMYDITVDSTDHRFYSNGILSHNTTVTSTFLLWYILFHSDKAVGILANKARTAQMIVNRMQLSYTLLPKWLQQGVTDWNKQSFSLENGSRVISAATSSDSIRGESLNCVTGDTKVTILDKNWCIYHIQIDKILSISKESRNYYYQYKTVNKDTKKEYTGYHQTDSLNDGFIGSGIELKQDIEKYGLDSFTFHIEKFFNYTRLNGYAVEIEDKEYYPVEDLQVLTDQGFKPFDGIKKSKSLSKIAFIFDDGSDLTCTGNHLLKMKDGTFRKASSITKETLFGGMTIASFKYESSNRPVYDLVNVADTQSYITNNVVSHNCLYIDECVTGNSKVTIQDKETGSIEETTMLDIWNILEDNGLNKRFTNRYKVFSNDANGFVSFDGIKKTRNKTILLKFNDRTELEGSWSHKILLKNKGLTELQKTECGDETTTGKVVASKDFLFEDKDLYDLLNTGEKHLYSVNGVEGTNCAFISSSVFDEFFRSVYPTISSSKSSKIILVSTPNGPNFFHAIWKKAQEGLNGYVPFQVNWWDVPGRDEKWKEEQIAATDEETFNQEFGCDFNTTTTTLIPSHKIKYIETMALKPINFNRTMKVYKNPQKNHTYVLSCDVADQGIDYSVVSVIDITEYPWEQVCVYRENISYIMFPPVIIHLANMYNNGYTLVENNDVGKTILHVLNYEYEMENIISTQIVSRRGGTSRYELGQRTTAKTKMLGCSQFKQLVNSNKIKINNDWTINEIKHFCIDSKGSYSADQPNEHDDCVMTLVNFSYFSTTPTYKLLFDKDVGEDIRAEEERMIEESLLPLPMESHNFDDNELTPEEVKWLRA